jgi:hypothetical protein
MTDPDRGARKPAASNLGDGDERVSPREAFGYLRMVEASTGVYLILANCRRASRHHRAATTWCSRTCGAACYVTRTSGHGFSSRLFRWATTRSILTTSTKPKRIQENFEISILPEDAMPDIRNRITANIMFNPVVDTGVPGFIPGKS